MNWTRKTSILNLCVIALLLLSCITGCLVLYFGHPAEYVWLPSCPFRVWTGLFCPGCGTLRSTHYLLNGQLCIAFRHQPLLFCLLPILTLLIGKMIYEKARNTPIALPFELQIYWTILIAVCLFFALRNIPLDFFDYLRPPSRGHCQQQIISNVHSHYYHYRFAKNLENEYICTAVMVNDGNG